MDLRRMMHDGLIIGGRGGMNQPKKETPRAVPVGDMFGIEPVPDDALVMIMVGTGGKFLMAVPLDEDGCREASKLLLAQADRLATVKAQEGSNDEHSTD